MSAAGTAVTLWLGLIDGNGKIMRLSDGRTYKLGLDARFGFTMLGVKRLAETALPDWPAETTRIQYAGITLGDGVLLTSYHTRLPLYLAQSKSTSAATSTSTVTTTTTSTTTTTTTTTTVQEGKCDEKIGSTTQPNKDAIVTSPSREGIVQVLAVIFERRFPCEYENFADRKRKTTPFDAQFCPPCTASKYFERLATRSKCSDAVLFLVLHHMCVISDRCKAKTLPAQLSDFQLDDMTVHRVMLALLVVITKFIDDDYMGNDDYAKIGGVLLKELNVLEVGVLEILGWNLCMPGQLYVKFVRSTCSNWCSKTRALFELHLATAHPDAETDEPLDGHVLMPRGWNKPAAAALIETASASDMADDADSFWMSSLSVPFCVQ